MESRTRKSFRNMLSGVGSKMIIFIFAFLVRTVFVRTLGAEYNGINGLFANILSVVCLADLGIENVLNFALYRELANGDQGEITKLIASFKRIYYFFAIFVLGVGLSILLVLDFVVDTTIPMNEVILYYLLYLLNSVATYLFVYKTTIIAADQNQYIANIVFTATRIVMYIMQTICLLLYSSMLGYLIIQIVCTLAYNIILNCITIRKYPYLKNVHQCSGMEIGAGLKRDIGATLVYRAAVVAIDNTDNIIISGILGTYFAGLYSNYYMLVQYIGGVIYIAGNGLLGSIGNLNAELDLKKSYRNFKSINLLYAIIGNIYLCCFVNCIQQFIPIWIGSEFLLPESFAVAITFSWYLGIIMRPVTMFRETFGLFAKVKKTMCIAAILNIILSIILSRIMGITGVVLGTIISKVVTQYWYEPVVLYEKFEISSRSYFALQVKYVFTVLISLLLSRMLCSYLGSDFISIVIRAMLTGIICIGCEVVINYCSEEFQELIKKIFTILRSRE